MKGRGPKAGGEKSCCRRACATFLWQRRSRSFSSALIAFDFVGRSRHKPATLCADPLGLWFVCGVLPAYIDIQRGKASRSDCTWLSGMDQDSKNIQAGASCWNNYCLMVEGVECNHIVNLNPNPSLSIPHPRTVAFASLFDLNFEPTSNPNQSRLE